MILALGIDAVDIVRFKSMAQVDTLRLQRLFSDAEIEYCTSNPLKANERFAARFAAKEAFYKALSSLLPNHQFFLLSVCRNVSVATLPNGAPILNVKWNYFTVITQELLPVPLTVHLSLTHTATTATAIVIFSKN